ncbi:uncharacterized protein LOC111711979 isoform X3 [Eurytemora carolleeae]|uniref:uncharacterized protein LOC111711979 isoform X1 n=1 Tax=Eurytemora carolleeae TaxID=1294199 RepID=UPI000C775964|nr:uncharacterized protein LOC111711979 isoform X1 [Eurytemora carolleeae]XP_023342250.1 uncharacterized protein LOC111711979 isoform X2 [Eurytemora carolleeae]XP_023342251.1 uncharacterized protein LOC111711979 isoform X3 [Eurytemora carolleeae]|eukprot:XP_023342249.1 uncharacterized protein LOC111711979 isoform X1 [Eurytemora affinis]
MYNKVKSGTDECLYYGFAVCGNRVLCREGYKSATGVLAHGKEVKEIVAEIVSEIGKDKMKIMGMGTKEDLDVLKPHLEPQGARLFNLDAGSMSGIALPSGCPDTHVSIAPEFIVPAGRMDEFIAGFPKFYAATKNGAGASGLLYYGFGVEGNSVVCREGYVNAEACLAHGADVKELLEEPLKVVGAGGMRLNVVGPKAELDKLRPKLEPRGAIFWELDSGALWK